MTVEAVKISGIMEATVSHTIPNDPIRGFYVSHVKIDGTKVKVGTPIACYEQLTNLEVQSVVQLILGRAVQVGPHLHQHYDSLEEGQGLRCWKAFSLIT